MKPSERASFARRRQALVRAGASRTRYKINPCSPEGWWVVIGYCLFVGIVPGLALLTGRQPPSVPRWITFAILLVASTAVFIAVLFRMSLPAENKEKGK